MPPVVWLGCGFIGRSQRKLPAFAVSRLHSLVGVLDIGDLALRGVPQQFAFVMDGHRAEHQPLGVFAGDAEVRAGGRAALAGTDPVAAMRAVIVTGARARRARQVRGREVVFRPTGAGQQAEAFAASTRAQITFRSNENAVVTAASSAAGTARPTASSRSAGCRWRIVGAARAPGASTPKAAASTGTNLRARVGNLARLFGRHARRQVSIAARVMMPIDRHRRQAGPSGELILDREFVRESEGRQRIFLDALDADQ